MKQEAALNILKMGHSVYLTGEAGAGKTYILNKYISWLKERGIRPAITASTGVAATHLEGSTIHSWSGIGIRNYITPLVLDQIEQKRVLWNRFQETEVLIIDEISMLSGPFLDMLDLVARHLKRAMSEPFGGMQIIFSGDFFQLPPVEKGRGESNYAFSSRAWSELQPVVCYLNEQHRQGDFVFLELLSAVRQRKITERHRKYLNGRCSLNSETESGFLRLFTHNEDVDKLNEEYLGRIEKEEYTFQMTSKGRDIFVDSLKKGCLAPECLHLKEGAEVMFVKNNQSGNYANGTQGVITGFKQGVPLVKTRSGQTILAEPVSWKREEDGKVLAEIKQVPLRLAWAVTVHKSQGMTLDEAEMDLSQCFVPGQGYVALSRVKSLDGLYLRGLNSTALEVDECVSIADNGFRKRSELAKSRLSQLSKSELEKRQKAFVKSLGGSWNIVKKKKSVNSSTLSKTSDLLSKGVKIEKIAKKRNLSVGTVMTHAEKILEQGTPLNFSYLAPNKKILSLVENAVLKHTFERLAPIKSHLENHGHKLSYDDLRRIRLFFLSTD